MILSALLLLVLAVAVCTAGIHKTLSLLGLSPMQTLLWLGIAEVPAPRSSRRRALLVSR